MPLVTVAIPTRNRSRLLLEALSSVLRQTHAEIDVVVSDNASGDDTWDLLQRCRDSRVRTFRQPSNVGMVNNWNFCLQEARGSHFCLLSDDDYLEPRFVERLLAACALDAKVAFAYGGMVLHDEKHGTRQEWPSSVPLEPGEEFVLRYFEGKRIVNVCSMMAPTHLLRQVGGYSREFPYAADAAAWTMLAFRGVVAHVAEPLVHYRLHQGGLSTALVPVLRDEVRLTELCEAEATGRALSASWLNSFRRAAGRRLARRVAYKMLSAADSGHQKRKLWECVREFYPYLKRDPLVSLPCAIAATVVPRLFVSALWHQHRRRRAAGT